MNNRIIKLIISLLLAFTLISIAADNPKKKPKKKKKKPQPQEPQDPSLQQFGIYAKTAPQPGKGKAVFIVARKPL